MNTLLEDTVVFTLEDLLEQLGGISSHRVLVRPLAGLSTEADVLRILEREEKLFELIDGVLVKRESSFPENWIASRISSRMSDYLLVEHCGYTQAQKWGVKADAKHIRFPDLTFVRYDNPTYREFRDELISTSIPDLIVETRYSSNTPREMEIKREEYFGAGTRLVWEIDPGSRTVEVFTSPHESTIVDGEGSLNGGDVMPGFTMPVRDLFAKPEAKA